MENNSSLHVWYYPLHNLALELLNNLFLFPWNSHILRGFFCKKSTRMHQIDFSCPLIALIRCHHVKPLNWSVTDWI